MERRCSISRCVVDPPCIIEPALSKALSGMVRDRKRRPRRRTLSWRLLCAVHAPVRRLTRIGVVRGGALENNRSEVCFNLFCTPPRFFMRLPLSNTNNDANDVTSAAAWQRYLAISRARTAPPPLLSRQLPRRWRTGARSVSWASPAARAAGASGRFGTRRDPKRRRRRVSLRGRASGRRGQISPTVGSKSRG